MSGNPYQEGQSSRRQGQPFTANPYPGGDEENDAHSWDEGWWDEDARIANREDEP